MNQLIYFSLHKLINLSFLVKIGPTEYNDKLRFGFPLHDLFERRYRASRSYHHPQLHYDFSLSLLARKMLRPYMMGIDKNASKSQEGRR